jgi:hypothetical protein
MSCNSFKHVKYSMKVHALGMEEKKMKKKKWVGLSIVIDNGKIGQGMRLGSSQ